MESPLCPVVLDRNGADVHGEARRLRERGPVTRIELPGGVQAWSVNTYDLVKQVLGDPQRFGKDPRNWPAVQGLDFIWCPPSALSPPPAPDAWAKGDLNGAQKKPDPAVR